MSGPILKNARTVLRDPRMIRSYARWTLGALGGGRHLDMEDGIRIAGFRHFSEFWGAYNGRPTAHERALIRGRLGRGGVAIDVGANIGLFALTMAAAQPTVTVHAFEPVPSNYARLVGNVERNRCANVVAHQLAVSDSNGFVRFTSDDASPATNRISSEGSARMVRSITLDDYCRACGIGGVDLLKVDVEGAEPLVLRGAASLLAAGRIKAMLIEVCPGNLVPFSFSVREISRPLSEAGYALVKLLPDGRAGAELADDELERITLENVLAVPVRDRLASGPATDGP